MDIRIGWEACMSACEPIIAEARAEVAGAYLAAAKAMRCKCAPDCKMINPVIGPDTILALTPEHSRQALEQRIAEVTDYYESILAMTVARLGGIDGD